MEQRKRCRAVIIAVFILALFACFFMYVANDLSELIAELRDEVPALPLDAGECGAAAVPQISLGLTADTAASATVSDPDFVTVAR